MGKEYLQNAPNSLSVFVVLGIESGRLLILRFHKQAFILFWHLIFAVAFELLWSCAGRGDVLVSVSGR